MWNTHFENLKKFIDENKNRPSQKSKNKKEKSWDNGCHNK
jgi:hypothetical protein